MEGSLLGVLSRGRRLHVVTKVYASPELWFLCLLSLRRRTHSQWRRRHRHAWDLGFPALNTRTTPVTRNSEPALNEGLVFVTVEPFTNDDCLVISLEVLHCKEAFPVGSTSISLAAIERRVDNRKVASKWSTCSRPTRI